MKIHSFGSADAPVMVLIHGMMTPWQVWTDQIERFRQKYFVIVPELDAHTEDEPSHFDSIEDEAQKIERAVRDTGATEISAMCGMSMGGAIAFEIWKNGSIDIGSLVLDGAPLLPMPKIAEKIMVMNYLSILKKTRARDAKTIERCRRDFLPDRYIEDMLKVTDNMSADSVRNIMRSVCSRNIPEGVENHSRILFIHGTKGNETFSKKAAVRLKELYPTVEVLCCEGDPHIYKAIYKTDVWIREVEKFLNKE